MKEISRFAVAILPVILTSCASNPQRNALAPVGPAPFEQSRGSAEGVLVVYSGFESGGTADQDASAHHSGYRIYFEDGKPLKYVSNWVATFSEEPAVVGLAPGRYKVVASAARFGTITVPVIIEPGKTTAVHLDQSEFPKGRHTASSEFVHLPNGFAVGWAANTDHP